MARRRRPPRPGGRPGRKRKKPKVYRPAEPRMPDTAIAHFEEQTRKDVAKLMKYLDKDLGLMEEERLLARVLEQHPEEQETFEQAGDHKVTGDEESIYVHIGLHRIVEQRVVSREIGALASGKSWHDAVHEKMDEVALELFEAEEEAVSR